MSRMDCYLAVKSATAGRDGKGGATCGCTSGVTDRGVSDGDP